MPLSVKRSATPVTRGNCRNGLSTQFRACRKTTVRLKHCYDTFVRILRGIKYLREKKQHKTVKNCSSLKNRYNRYKREKELRQKNISHNYALNETEIY